jgi:hypothetical protein
MDLSQKKDNFFIKKKISKITCSKGGFQVPKLFKPSDCYFFFFSFEFTILSGLSEQGQFIPHMIH